MSSKKILVQVSHPAHVHFFKHFISDAQSEGYGVLVVAREKDITTDLLEAEGIDYITISKKTSKIGIVNQIQHTWRMLQAVREFEADIILAIGGLAACHVSSLTQARSFVFTDSEGVTSQTKLGYPLADRIYTPQSYRENYGQNQIRYPGYHELAYLHPNRFEPNLEKLKEYGIEPQETFSVLRFVSWEAQHDIGESGFSPTAKSKLCSLLDSEGDVYITSESELPPEFEEYRLPIPPHLIHDLLFAADYYIGESGTMAIEAGLLGTPSIRSNSFAGEDDRGVFNELMHEYNLVKSYSDESEAISKAEEFIKDDSIEYKWKERQKKLLVDKIDVSNMVLEEVKNS